MSRFVAIIGRPNVGKSTLFNRLLGERKAIVEDIPGITRDRIYGRCLWEEEPVDLIDTGGFDPSPDDPLLKIMKQQVDLALEEADAIIFVMDGKTGFNPVDEEIFRMVGQGDKPFFLAVNKIDSPEKERDGFDFYQLGVNHLYFMSATHGRGIGPLMDDVVETLPSSDGEAALDSDIPRVAVVGRPNVGKSTLVNQLLGHQRLLTSDMPGTTRDSVDSMWESPDGKPYVLVDTAGMRRKRNVRDAIEYYSVVRAIKAMERAHVVLLLLDSRFGMEDQDAKIANLIANRGRGFIIAYNKWDLIQKDHKTSKTFVDYLREAYPTLSYVPAIFISASTGKGVQRLMPLVEKVKSNWQRRITTGELNRFLEKVVAKTPPPLVRHRPGKIFFASQPEVGPPTFVLTVNHPDYFAANYRRFLLNRIREEYGFTGSPIRLFLRKRKQKETT